MQFSPFDINLYFSKNYGMGAKPGAGSINRKRILIGVLAIIVGVIALALSIVFKGALVGVIILAVGIAVALIAMLPTILSKKKAQNNADAWQAEFEHRKSTWDHEYDEFYKKTVNQMNLRATAMSKLSIVDEQLADVQPFYIYGSILNGAHDWYRTDVNGTIRADHNEITWLFFSKDQVYLYNIKFRLTNGKRVETTQEFFYTDIVSVQVGSESTAVDSKNCIDGASSGVLEMETFKLTVPGDKMSFAFTSNDGVTGSIQAMRNKIREKKVG